VDIKHPSGKITTAGHRLLLVALIAGVGWGASALGATTNKADCDAHVRPADVLESPLAALSITPVDHVSIEVENSTIDELETDQRATDRAAPYLYLTPRVVSVLRDIFDFARDDAELEIDVVQDAVSSPLAEAEDETGTTNFRYKALPSPAADEQQDLPLLQRQMFRTDI